MCHPLIITPSDVFNVKSTDSKLCSFGCLMPIEFYDEDLGNPGTTKLK